jgi:hypothetical protein
LFSWNRFVTFWRDFVGIPITPKLLLPGWQQAIPAQVQDQLQQMFNPGDIVEEECSLTFPTWGSTSTSTQSLELGSSDESVPDLPEFSPLTDPVPLNTSLPPTAVPNRSGQVRGKAFLVTWSQSPNLSREMILEHLKTLGVVESAAVGQERHQDEGIHYHAMVIFQSPIQRSPNAFNVLGRHPNVRVANARVGTYSQSLVNMWTYVLKSDQNPLIFGAAPTSGGVKRKRDEFFSEALEIATSTSVQSAMEFLLKNCPYDALTRFDAIERALVTTRARSVQVSTQARALTEFPKAPSVPEDWHALFVSGPTGLGKTQWAKALLPGATIVSHTDQLRTVDFSKGVIFDDFAMSHWPPAAAIHMLDWDEPRGINVKHGHVVIPPHTKKIFTFNVEFDYWVPKEASFDQIQAMKRRITILAVNESLF